MSRRHLLLCFDAFGTLFKPRLPIAEQYAATARESGFADITAAQVQHAFKAAFTSESKLHPNYGRASGMGAEKWWTNVIHATFHPLTAIRPLPPSLAPKLLHRFSSAEGYALTAPALPSLLRAARSTLSASPFLDGVVMGVITNSDDRIPSILASLGLRTSPLRGGTPPPGVLTDGGDGPWDIDMHCMSYDVGHAKPDRRIFDAAMEVAGGLVENGEGGKWLKVYVGDEFGADVVGGLGAGWNVVLVGEGGEGVDEGLLLPEGVEGPREVELGNGEMAWERVFGLDGEGSKGLVYLRANTVEAVLRWLARM